MTPYPGPGQATGGVLGATMGGIAGAVIGNQSGRPLEGAAIGSAIGALAGSALGHADDVNRYYHYPPAPAPYYPAPTYYPPPAYIYPSVYSFSYTTGPRCYYPAYRGHYHAPRYRHYHCR